MLGCLVKGYKKACRSVQGGIDQLFIGDSNDFDFTSGALDDEDEPTGYSAIALHSGATLEAGAGLFEIQSIIDSMGLEIAQANAEGATSSYEYTFTARLAQMSQALTNFNYRLDAAALCCEMLFLWRMNDGKIFVVGERNVDSDILPRFRFRQDGSRINTGKKFTDFNGEDLSVKGSYSRKPYELTAGWNAISAFIVAPAGSS